MPTEVKRYRFDIAELRRRIDWSYFFWAWGIARAGDEERRQLQSEADRMLTEWEGAVNAEALLMRTPANSDADDILVGDNLDIRLPMLRQQKALQPGQPLMSMADFVRPLEQGVPDEIGIFCTTVSVASVTPSDADPYRRMLVQTLADRLAEAAAERISDEMPGIRPAVGYPMMPDMSMNFLLDAILDMKQVGITLTQSGMMQPHASVSGLIFRHPRACYFNIGTIGDDQIADYARRRAMTVEQMRRFLKS